MFEPFQNFIPRAANVYGISKEAEAARVCHLFRLLIPDLFPSHDHPESSVQPAYYKGSTLVIKTSTPAWSQEVIMRKPQIINSLNEKLGKEVIKNLRTQLHA